ncbi:hypothetical protein [Chitinimonas lacunae]|uniref:Uncharacterized protein n=1 Tax=Chitinimonas lacunae TaxID=1963018 RepID=A0ABV8MKN6_9NEIS
MDCREETAGAARFHFCPDRAPPPADRLRALVQARVLDEISGQPIERCRVTMPDPALAPHMAARVAAGGLVGLVGHPARLFPTLATSAVTLPIQLEADGYLPRQLSGTLGPVTGFPAQFAPLDHGDVVLHRLGVRFSGRVVARGTPANQPLAGAQLRIDGLWSTFPPANAAPGPLMEPARIVGLTPGLYADYPTATLARCDVVPDLPRSKTLLATAPPGSQRLRLSDRRTLAVGMALLIDGSDPDRHELMPLAHIDTSSSDDQPAWVELAHPLRHLHRLNSPAVPAAIPATHDPHTLSRAALTGDAVAFLNAAPPWSAGTVIRIDDSVRPVEYHWLERYETSADAEGYFRLPCLARVALTRLRVTHPSQPQPLNLVVEPNYRLVQQTLVVAFE